MPIGGSDETDSKSITGYTFLIGNGAVTWSAKKQDSVARSTQQAEYQVYSSAGARSALDSNPARGARFRRSGNALPKSTWTTRGAIELGKHPKFHARAKHIRISYHEVRSYIADKEIAIVYCPSAENAADIFTKGLPRPAHDRMLDLIGMDRHSRGSVDSTV